VRIGAGALGNRRPYRDKITAELGPFAYAQVWLSTERTNKI